PPIFSPATKADLGHDENVTFTHVVKALGRPLAEQLKRASLGLYEAGRAHAAPRGIIIADTKFEFGSTPDGRLHDLPWQRRRRCVAVPLALLLQAREIVPQRLLVEARLAPARCVAIGGPE